MKTTFEITSTPNNCTLHVAGDLTAQAAAEFKTRLQELRNTGEQTEREISLLGLTSVDVTGLQLLQAAREAFDKDGKKLLVKGPEDAGVAGLIVRTGFRKLLNI